MISKLPDHKILRDLYTGQRLTLKQIGDRYGVSRQRVQQRLVELGIQGNSRRLIKDPAVLRKLYLDERLTQLAISKALGVSRRTVWTELKRNGIERPKK